MTWKNKNNRQIALWLLLVCGMIFTMVIVGGITRLTESGLSMVHWQPLSGIIPPLNKAEWAREFSGYKQYPEYLKTNLGMSLAEFKSIFFWEYSHRLLGRLIGIVFFIPFVFFLFNHKVSYSLKPKLWILFFLGGLQGLLGWWMVKSGLVDRPDVSHYRLTAHLGLAIVIYIYMFWVASSLLIKRYENPRERPVTALKFLVGMIFIQILLGGLVAGLNAGKVYNTWPLIKGAFIPTGLYRLTPWYVNMGDNVLTVQFDHRMLAYAIVLLATYLWLKMRQDRHIIIRLSAHLLFAAILAQVTLGILTLVNAVPIPLGVLHQAGAMISLTVALFALRHAKN